MATQNDRKDFRSWHLHSKSKWQSAHMFLILSSWVHAVCCVSHPQEHHPVSWKVGYLFCVRLRNSSLNVWLPPVHYTSIIQHVQHIYQSQASASAASDKPDKNKTSGFQQPETNPFVVYFLFWSLTETYFFLPPNSFLCSQKCFFFSPQILDESSEIPFLPICCHLFFFRSVKMVLFFAHLGTLLKQWPPPAWLTLLTFHYFHFHV